LFLRALLHSLGVVGFGRFLAHHTPTPVRLIFFPCSEPMYWSIFFLCVRGLFAVWLGREFSRQVSDDGYISSV
jgi:hypothetical protein